MLKRILAWIILIGFVLLLLNIAIFKFYWQVSLAVYVIIIIFFVLSSGKIIPIQDNAGYGKADDDRVSGAEDATADEESGKSGTGDDEESKGN